MWTPLVGFVSDRERDEFASGLLAPLLYDIFAYSARYARSLGWKMDVVSIYRTPEEDAAVKGSGVHPAWRAVDVRTVADGIQPNTVQMVADHVNSFWQYDPSRPAKLVFFNEPGAEFGPHAHIQVHDLTVRVKKGG